jgi:hypothetical protein
MDTLLLPTMRRPIRMTVMEPDGLWVHARAIAQVASEVLHAHQAGRKRVETVVMSQTTVIPVDDEGVRICIAALDDLRVWRAIGQREARELVELTHVAAIHRED